MVCCQLFHSMPPSQDVLQGIIRKKSQAGFSGFSGVRKMLPRLKSFGQALPAPLSPPHHCIHCIHVTFISVFFKALLGLLSCATLYCWVVNMSNMSTFSTIFHILSHNSLHQSLQICGQWDLSHPTFNLFLIVGGCQPKKPNSRRGIKKL